MQQTIAMIPGSEKEVGVKPRGWSSIGYHVQRDNEDGFLSLDFGLKEFGVKGSSERLRYYRKFLYEKGGIDNRQKAKVRSEAKENNRPKRYYRRAGKRS